tara:strand:- start:88 stop:636 length:549 start_codon:yes stop_codon:yes gene_type:complete
LKQLSFEFEESQPLELCDNDILPETYVMYRTGGKHPFYGVPNTFPIYQELIWPRIKRISYPDNQQKIKGAEQANPCLSVDKPYPYITLQIKGFRTVNRKGRRPAEAVNTKFFRQHRLVALLFVTKPPGKDHVMHLNNDPTNYLPSNLKWGTGLENHKDRGPDSKITMTEVYLGMKALGKIKG